MRSSAILAHLFSSSAVAGTAPYIRSICATQTAKMGADYRRTDNEVADIGGLLAFNRGVVDCQQLVANLNHPARVRRPSRY